MRHCVVGTIIKPKYVIDTIGVFEKYENSDDRMMYGMILEYNHGRRSIGHDTTGQAVGICVHVDKRF
jgi:hypothetical protein